VDSLGNGDRKRITIIPNIFWISVLVDILKIIV
jgi:hypothetical protein